LLWNDAGSLFEEGGDRLLIKPCLGEGFAIGMPGCGDIIMKIVEQHFETYWSDAEDAAEGNPVGQFVQWQCARLIIASGRVEHFHLKFLNHVIVRRVIYGC